MLRHSRLYVPVFYVAIGALAFVYRTDITAWAEHMASDAHVGTWVSFAALLAFAVVVALPISPIFVLSGYAFGLPGIAVSLVGAYAGSCVSFAVARRVRFEAPDSTTLETLRMHGPRFIGWLRLSPFIPISAINVGAGILGIEWKRFLRTLPPSGVSAVLFTAAGALGSSLMRGEVDGSVGWVVGLAAVSVVGLIIAAWRTRSMLDRSRESLAPMRVSTVNPTGTERQVGIEMEFVGIDVDEAARVVVDVLGGTIRPGESVLERMVDTELGAFRVERDSKPLKDAADLDRDERDFRDRAILLTKPMVPLEIVSPPMPVRHIGVMDEIADHLRDAGARGTSRSIFDALGVHLNPEALDQSARGIRNTLRAYFLLRDWLREDMDVDLSRRVSPWIAPHSEEYVELVLDPDYDPTLDELVEDYLRLEPSRNRDLDLLPLFAHLRPEAVSELDEELIKARPTYHYRLPNCDLDDPEWTVSQEWKRWRLVERLAADEMQLNEWLASWWRVKNRFAAKWDAPVEGRVA